jgi:predicted phage terminase large subunit-like protein
MHIETQKLVQTKFLAFAMKAFAGLNKGKRLGKENYLKLLAEKLKDVAAGDIKRLIVSMPPRHGKTFMGSICLSAWILAHDSSAKILVLSYGQELADKIAYAIRAILQSDWFKEAFNTRLAKNRSRVMDFLTTDGGGVRSLSIEGGVTGLGADFIIIDDPVEIKDCDNIKRLERVNDLFDNEIQTRLDHPKKGGIVIIAHRINENDLPGRVLQKGGWQQLKLPLIATRSRTYELPDGEVWHRKKAELLRPGAFTKRDIQRLRASKQPGFETLQQQNPGGRDRLRIKAKYFPVFSLVNVQLRDLSIVLSIDPGQKGGPTNSFSVIQVWAPRDGAHLLLDQWREQTNYQEFRSQTRLFIRKYRPSVVLIEDTGQGPALISDIKQQNGMDLVQITPIGDKVERLRKHRRAIRSGLVQLSQCTAWSHDFIEEATQFPYGPFDDQMDALSQYLDWIAKHPTPHKRPPMALVQGVDSQGRKLGHNANRATSPTKGVAVARGSHWRRWRF